MATLAGVSAKVGDLSGFSSYNVTSGTLTVDTNDWRTVDLGQITGRAFRAQVSGTSAAVYGTVSLAVAKATVYVRMACRINNSSASEVTLIQFLEGAVIHDEIRAQASTGTIKAYRATTNTDSTAGNAFVPSTWFLLEVWLNVHDSTGRCQAKINGVVTDLDFTGDTRNAGTTGLIDSIRFGCPANAPNPYDIYFDDIGISDSGYLGTGAWIMLKPTADGSTMNWTPSTGSAWDTLNETPPSMTDFIYTDATVAATKALFALENLPSTPTAIGPVIVVARGRTSGAGGGSVKPTVKSDATNLDGTAVALDTTERNIIQILDTDPATAAAWTEAGVNALEAGVVTA